MGEADMASIAGWICQTLRAADDERALTLIANDVKAFCRRFPVPGLE